MYFKTFQSIFLSLVYLLAITQLSAQPEKNTAWTNGAAVDANIKAVTFRLFPTQNMWTFIKLNTQSGQLWQVQYDITSNNRFQSVLSEVTLAPPGKEVNDRFTLHATQNIYNFLLLDQLDGRVWQVQWSADQTKRGILPIE